MVGGGEPLVPAPGAAVGTFLRVQNRWVFGAVVRGSGRRGRRRRGLPVHTLEHLETVAAELNSRPRKTLGWQTPAERLARLLDLAS